MKKLMLVIILFSFLRPVFSQELKCQVQVVSQKIQSANKMLYDAMRKDIYEFMNNTKWTDHVYSNEERIECTIMITIDQQIGSERFVGSLQVQSKRPIFNTNYQSPILNLKEKEQDFQFEYTEQQSIEFNLNSFTSSLSSTLAFYAYIIIGMDYDTYTEEGGGEYFQNALSIVQNAQNAAASGWKAYEDMDQKNRYWIAENLNSETFSPLRKTMYEYHRQGLDQMTEKPDQGRERIAEGLKNIRTVYRSKPNSALLSMFFNSKSDEIVKIFSDESVPARQKGDIYNLLQEVDPTGGSKYQKIKQ